MEIEETEAKPVFSKKVHVLIDADSLIYRAAHLGEKAQKEVDILPSHPLWKEGLLQPLYKEQQDILHSMVEGILYNMEEGLNQKGMTIVNHNLLFTPKAEYCRENNLLVNFRYELVNKYNEEQGEDVPGYKASRKGMQLPEGIPELFDHCMNLENKIVSNHSEADDEIVRLKKQDPEKYILAVLDKDIYEGCEGEHWNYNRNEWVTTTDEEAELFVMRQCMTGDSSDGIKGIYRYGPKAAEKDLPEWLPTEEMWSIVLARFFDKGYTENYAILMMRLVNLNQLNPAGELELWEPPFKHSQETEYNWETKEWEIVAQ